MNGVLVASVSASASVLASVLASGLASVLISVSALLFAFESLGLGIGRTSGISIGFV